MTAFGYGPYRAPRHKTKAFRVLSERELRQLEILCSIFCTYAEVCRVLRMSKSTLTRMRRDDPRVLLAMDRGYALARVKLRRRMFAQAEKHPEMAMFLAKNILGYRDDWDPIDFKEFQRASSSLSPSPEELKIYARELFARAGRAKSPTTSEEGNATGAKLAVDSDRQPPGPQIH